jgi:peptide deformylase
VAVRDIVLYPDPILKQRCEPVDPSSELGAQIAQDLIDTLEAAPGVGVAAPQIGYAYRVIVVDARRSVRHTGQGRFLLFDPVIAEASGQQVFREGCLSIPDYTGKVTRFEELVVVGTDETGAETRISASGFEAVVFQHEIDHLDGVLFLDRITNVKTDLFRRKPRR